MVQISIEDMVILVQKGDAEAFDMLFEKYKNEAVRTAYLITGSQSICEDIAQEAFITCFKEIGNLKNPKTFKAWFYRILTRVAWRYGKLASREVAVENIVERSDLLNMDISVEQHTQSERNQMLYTEIYHLKPNQKIVIILYYFNGLSTKEISMVLNCFEGTVKSRLYAARQNLKKSLETPKTVKKGSELVAKKGIA